MPQVMVVCKLIYFKLKFLGLLVQSLQMVHASETQLVACLTRDISFKQFIPRLVVSCHGDKSFKKYKCSFLSVLDRKHWKY